MKKETSSLYIIKFLFISIIILLNLTAYATDPIIGKVVDAKSNKPIPFVHIDIIGKNYCTVTDINGNFSISLPDKCSNDKICIYTKGYQPKMYRVADLQKSNSSNSIEISKKEEFLFEMQPIPSPIIIEDSPKLNRYNLDAGWIF